MKKLFLFLIIPLNAMSPITGRIPKERPTHPLPCKRVSFETDMNMQALPGLVELEDDVKYLHLGYDKARETINSQSDVIRGLQSSVAYAHKRIDFLQESIENLNKKVNRIPWYKRLCCFKRK